LSAARGDIDDGVGRASDLGQKLHENRWIGRGPAIGRIASMQVKHRRPRLSGRNGLFSDLLRRERQVWAHGGGMDGSRYRATYDDFAQVCTVVVMFKGRKGAVTRMPRSPASRVSMASIVCCIILYECKGSTSRCQIVSRIEMQKDCTIV
jgi:hypothetical protein